MQETSCAGSDRAFVGGVDIVYVEIERACRYRPPRRLTQHQSRVTDIYFRVHHDAARPGIRIISSAPNAFFRKSITLAVPLTFRNGVTV